MWSKVFSKEWTTAYAQDAGNFFDQGQGSGCVHGDGSAAHSVFWASDEAQEQYPPDWRGRMSAIWGEMTACTQCERPSPTDRSDLVQACRDACSAEGLCEAYSVSSDEHWSSSTPAFRCALVLAPCIATIGLAADTMGHTYTKKSTLDGLTGLSLCAREPVIIRLSHTAAALQLSVVAYDHDTRGPVAAIRFASFKLSVNDPARGPIWRPVFRQTHPFVQPAADWVSYNPTQIDAPNFSALDTLEGCRGLDGKLLLKIVWPNRASPNYNEWKQSSNPLTEPRAGYEAVDVHFTAQSWAGLGSESSSALLDGSPGDHYWYYAVGATEEFAGGFPGPGTAESVVELHALCPGMLPTLAAGQLNTARGLQSTGWSHGTDSKSISRVLQPGSISWSTADAERDALFTLGISPPGDGFVATLSGCVFFDEPGPYTFQVWRGGASRPGDSVLLSVGDAIGLISGDSHPVNTTALPTNGTYQAAEPYVMSSAAFAEIEFNYEVTPSMRGENAQNPIYEGSTRLQWLTPGAGDFVDVPALNLFQSCAALCPAGQYRSRSADCITVAAGLSSGGSRSFDVPAGYICPATVDRANWLPDQSAPVNLALLSGVLIIPGPGFNGGNALDLIDSVTAPAELDGALMAAVHAANLNSCAEAVYMTVDLGAVYQITGTRVWHYWNASGAERSYCNQKTALSTTGMFDEPEFGAIAIVDVDILNENGAVATGWSDGFITDAGASGTVHGPWGSDTSEVGRTVLIPSGISLCNVSWRSWAIDSRDGELDQAFINDVQVWSAAGHHSCSGWNAGRTDFPQAWGGDNDVCYVDVSVSVACAGSMEVYFQSDVDQGVNDEGWGFSNFRVTASQATTTYEYGPTESADGVKTVFGVTPARYVRHWTGRSTVDSGVHVSEIAVYGLASPSQSAETFLVAQEGTAVTVTRSDTSSPQDAWSTVDLHFKCCQVDSAVCATCGAGYETNALGGVGASTCFACSAGQYSGGPGESCQPCRAGYTLDAAFAATSCTACPAGQFAPNSTVACQACPAGSATDSLTVAAATSCTACAAGQFSPISTTACLGCRAGYFTNAAVAATNCTECPVGQSSSTSTSGCLPTPTLLIEAPSTIGQCGGLTLRGVLGGYSVADFDLIAATWSWNGTDELVTTALHASNEMEITLDPWSTLGTAYFLFSLEVSTLVGSVPVQVHTEITVMKRHADIPAVSIAGPQSITTQQSRGLTLRAAAALPSCGESEDAGTALYFVWSVQSDAIMQLDDVTWQTSTLYLPPGFLPAGLYVNLRVTACTSVTTCNSDTVTVYAVPDPFEVHILGGSFRTVGNVNSFEMEATTSLAAADEVGFQWLCRDEDGDVALTGSGISWQLTAGALPVGNYTFEVNATHGIRNAQSAVSLRLELGEPPSVSIVINSARMQAKFNPAQKLALMGSVVVSSGLDSSRCSNCNKEWTAEVCQSDCVASAAWSAVDLSVDGFILTSLSNLNLVVGSGKLLPGMQYRFRLDSWVEGIDGSPIGSSVLQVAINAPPSDGLVAVSPASGMAVQDTFTLRTSRWIEDDLPLRYRFATLIQYAAGGTSQRFSYLSEFDALASIQANLAAGHRNVTFVVVEAQDVLGAVATANTSVAVVPFMPAVGASMASVAANLINISSSVGNLQRIGQIVLSLAASLNSDTSTSAEEARQTRDVLINAVVGMGEAVTPDAVARASQTLSAVTAKSAELSETATDKSLEFATKLSTEFKGSLSSNDVSNLAATVSSVLSSSTRIFFTADDNSSTSQTDSQSAVNDARTRARAQKLSDCVSSLALVVAAGQVAGEEQQTFSTASFSMSIKKDDPVLMANKTVGSGTVTIPSGLFPAGTAAVAATVVEWEDAGPLFFAADQSPAGTEGALRSPVLSVSFSDDADQELSVTGLAIPFVINLSATNGNQSNESAGCAHWDIAGKAWVQDGVLTARYDDHITCEFSHLTDFGGFIGPMPTANTVSNPFDFAMWADNITGAVMSGLILLCAASICCWSLADYNQRSNALKKDKDYFDARTTEYVHTRMHASATSHTFCLREWLLLRWGCQLFTTMKPHSGDPYLRSQRMLVFANALLVSLVCGILFFDVDGEPECCSCISNVCGRNSTTWSHGNKTCAELSIVEGEAHCEEGEEADNGLLSALLCAVISLPIVATMHLSFRWVRRPLENFILIKVLQHEQRNIVVMGATGLAQGDLLSQSDPYCKVFFNGFLVGRTKVIIGTSHPTWNAAFNLIDAIGPIPETENVVRFEIWDHDTLSMDEFLGQVSLRGTGAAMLPEDRVTGFTLQPQEEVNPAMTPRGLAMAMRKSFGNEDDAMKTMVAGEIFIQFVQQEIEHLGHANPHRPTFIRDNHVFVYPDDAPEQGGHRIRGCRALTHCWRQCCAKKKQNQVSKIGPAGYGSGERLPAGGGAEPVLKGFFRGSGLDGSRIGQQLPPPPILAPDGPMRWKTPAHMRNPESGDDDQNLPPLPPPPDGHAVISGLATPRDDGPRPHTPEGGLPEDDALASGTALSRSTAATSTARLSDRQGQKKILDAASVGKVAEALKDHTMPRGFAKSILAYTYCFVVGVTCSLIIAGVTINFGEEKTIDFIFFTLQSLGCRLFLFEPIKVLCFGSAFEALAGLITGEAESCSESMVDVVADTADQMAQELGTGSAAIAGAGALAGSRTGSRAEVQRMVHSHTEQAKLKLVATTAFTRAGAKSLPPASPGGLPKIRMSAPWQSTAAAAKPKTPSPGKLAAAAEPNLGSPAGAAPLSFESPSRSALSLPALIPSPSVAKYLP